MSTPKEKAIDLVEKYANIPNNANNYDYDKQCALIAVDEIIEELKSIELNYDLNFQTDLLPYYLEVKNEIENL